MSKETTHTDKAPGDTWAEIVGPSVARLHAASALNKPINMTPQGCKAMALLLANMARKLDTLEGNYKPLDNQT